MITITLSEHAFQAMPHTLQEALLRELVRRFQGASVVQQATGLPSGDVQSGAIDGGGEKPADFSESQAGKFLEVCSDKTKKVLREIFANKDHCFRIIWLRRLLNDDKLDGVWGGITKRTRTILGDKNARLIVWNDEFKDGKWEDSVGRVSAITYISFRAALGL